MEELTPAQVASLPKGTVISRLRFIPKTDGMRPITRVIGADAKTRVRTNSYLRLVCYYILCPWAGFSTFLRSSLQLYRGRVRDLLDMLRACVRATPSLLGSTVWGMTDIHKVLCSLAPAQKEKPQPLYFVKVSCYI